ncbi:MAG: hydroxyacid dehydrogenase [Alphaproteobacteria bacterium]|nr:hydroxyacid dehydrogenase [Alphaproteobacteria bacterium]HCP01386.1 hydroxyacid dehydrogenase [Rhodospirillaceae bacterium]
MADSTIFAVADSPFPSLEPVETVLASLNPSINMAADTSEDAIIEVAKGANALFVTYAQITAKVIDSLDGCGAIGRFGIGLDNIDLDAATAAGIPVVYAPQYCLDEVSDHTMALLLTAARKTALADKLVKKGRWEMPAVAPIMRFRGKTMGLVGFGNIAQLVAQKAQAFGINVISSDPFVKPEIAEAKGVELVDFDALLERSDYVSVHAPLTPATENMFSTEAFAKMKSSAFIVNTARGGLIDTAALVAALDAGEIAGAGLDVLPQEPPAEDDPILNRDNVVINPHTSFYSEDALLDLQTTVAGDVLTVLNGEQPKWPANPDVFK